MLDQIEVKEFGKFQQNIPSLISIHGGPAIPYYMCPIAERLSKDYYVIDYVQRSRIHTKAAPPYDMKAHRGDLAKLLETYVQARSNRAILIAHSWGALLALSFISHYPDSAVDGLILICPAPIDPLSREGFAREIEKRLNPEQLKRRLKIIRQAKAASSPEKLDRHIWNEYWQIMAPAYFYEPNLAADYPWPDWDYECFDSSLRSAAEEFKAHQFVRSRPDIQQIDVIGASHDLVPFKSVFSWIKSEFPNAKAEEIKNCGHFPWLEKFETREKFYKLLNEKIQNVISNSRSKDTSS